MRILAAADVHGVLPVYEWLLEVARREADLLVLAGDLFAGDIADVQRRKAAAISELLRTSGMRVLYLMGNDDNVSLGFEDERVRSVHGRRLSLDGRAFVGYQFSPPFVGRTFVKPESAIAADLVRLEPLLDEQTVFVTHAPALGAADATFMKERVGSSAIASFLQRRPCLIHIHGHIHESFGREGNHFNVASAGMRRAMLIDLATLAHKVVAGGSV